MYRPGLSAMASDTDTRTTRWYNGGKKYLGDFEKFQRTRRGKKNVTIFFFFFLPLVPDTTVLHQALYYGTIWKDVQQRRPF